MPHSSLHTTHPSPSRTQAQSSAWVYWTINFLIFFSFFISLVPTTLDYLDIGLRLETDLSEGTRARQVQLLALLGVAAWLLYRHPSHLFRSLRHTNVFLLALLFYTLCTALWSLYPIVTLKRVFIFGLLIFTGIAIAPPLAKPMQLIRTLTFTITLLCALSLLAAVVVPHIGLDSYHQNALRGITWHKNLLGRIAAFGLLFWVAEWTHNEHPRWQALVGGLITLLCLLLAKSSTAVLLAGVGLAVYLYWHRAWLADYYFNPLLLLLIGLVATLGLQSYFLIFGHLPDPDLVVTPISEFFRKSSDLTGRSDIWQALQAFIKQHPILGVGYGAFWLGAGSPSELIADAIGFMPAHGHNGYLDIWNELGLIGLSLFIGVLIVHFYNLLYLRRYDTSASALHLAVLITILAGNITETDLLSSMDFQNIVFIYSVTTVAARVAMLRHQQTQPQPLRRYD